MLHSAASFSRLLPEMVSPKELAAIVQSSLLGASGTSPTQRIELTHALRNSFSSFQNLLSFPVLDFGDPSRSFSIILRFRLSSHSIFVFFLCFSLRRRPIERKFSPKRFDFLIRYRYPWMNKMLRL